MPSDPYTLQVERVFPATPAALWPWLTVPERMNRWSTATVALVAPGPAGRPDEAEARRTVTVRVAGVGAVLHERIVAAEPGRRLVYRVERGPNLRWHEGTQALAPVDGGTRLTWTVRYRPWVPLTGRLLRAVVEPQLARSLDVLRGLLHAP